MALTKVGVVYSKSQYVVRRVIYSDSSDEEVDIHQECLLNGEGWIDIPINVYHSFKSPIEIQSYIASALLSIPTSDNCAVVDGSNMIIACVRADPIIDDHPDGILICDGPATAGDSYDFENAVIIYKSTE